MDLLRLRDVICAQESRTAEPPESAVYHDREASSVDLGYCQLNVDTLVTLRFLARPGQPATRPAGWVFEREGSRAIALELLERALLAILARGGRPTYACLAVKYRWGLAARCTRARLASAYVTDILAGLEAP